MASFAVPSGLQIFLRSPSGDLLAVVSDNDQTGEILNAKVVVKKIGGVDSFSFSLARTFPYPVTRDTRCHFYVDGAPWFSGYVKEAPLQDAGDDFLLVQGEGFYKRLKNKLVTTAYSAETLENIVKGVAQAQLGADVGVFYDAAKIDVPVLADLDVSFDDQDLLSVFTTLLQIANYDYDSAKYRLYVDDDLDLVFEQVEPSTHRTLFEGFDYQRPKTSRVSTKMVNKILAFRTNDVNPEALEYVATHEDIASQANYGVLQRKLVVPAYLSDDAVQRICEGILARRSGPTEKVEVEQLLASAPLPFGDYLLSNRRDDYWFALSECDSFDDWDLSAFAVSDAALSAERTLTGRLAFKITAVDGSAGEYIELTLPSKVPFPKLVRSFLYFAAATPEVELRYYDAAGGELSVLFGRLERELWVDVAGVGEDSLGVDPNGSEDSLGVDFVTGAITDQWVRLASDAASLVDVSRVRLTILGNSALSFYLDRIDAQAGNYSTRRLQLEEASYEMANRSVLASASFGEAVDNVFTEIDDKVEEGGVALAIVAKQ